MDGQCVILGLFWLGLLAVCGTARAQAWFPDWTETDTTQTSLTQYVGQVTGARQSGTVNDCSPSPSCSTRADNLFRQARRAGISAVNFVEGANAPCSVRYHLKQGQWPRTRPEAGTPAGEGAVGFDTPGTQTRVLDKVIFVPMGTETSQKRWFEVVVDYPGDQKQYVEFVVVCR